LVLEQEAAIIEQQICI